jgi:FkbM family methyltransferase
LVDALGLILAVVVHSDALQDREGAKLLLPALLNFGWVRKVFAGGGYAGPAARLGQGVDPTPRAELGNPIAVSKACPNSGWSSVLSPSSVVTAVLPKVMNKNQAFRGHYLRRFLQDHARQACEIERSNDFLDTLFGGSSGTATVAIAPDGVGSTVLAMEASVLFPEKISLPLHTLDELLESGLLTPPDLVKMDVQGSEDRILRGGHQAFNCAQCCRSNAGFILVAAQRRLARPTLWKCWTISDSLRSNPPIPTIRKGTN